MNFNVNVILLCGGEDRFDRLQWQGCEKVGGPGGVED